MKHITPFIAILLFLASCGAQHASAPASAPSAIADTTDNWEAYMGHYEGGAGSTLVNMSLQAKAPMAQYPFVLITGVKFSKCEDGLPAKAAFAGLYDISDSVEGVVAAHGKAMKAGTFTHECKRLDYYYIADTTGMRAALTKLYVMAFAGYEASIHIATDKQWDAYLKFLYPNDAAKQYIQDQKVIDNLAKAGDDAAKPRPIDYGLYFKTEQDREQFVTYALQQNYTIDSKAKVEGEFPYELSISKVSAIDVDLINATGIELKKQAVKFNGEYDGWGAGVVK